MKKLVRGVPTTVIQKYGSPIQPATGEVQSSAPPLAPSFSRVQPAPRRAPSGIKGQIPTTEV